MALSFLVLKNGEEAVGMVISLTRLAGVAMVTGIKDYNENYAYCITEQKIHSISCYAVMCTRFHVFVIVAWE